MAQLIPYLRKSGTTTYGVKWRLGGVRSGATAHETFRDEKQAKFFKADVERCGHQYPPNYVPKFGYVDPAVLAEEKARMAAESAQEALAKPVLFADRYSDFLATITGAAARTVKDYERQFLNHLLPAFGDMVVNTAAEAGAEKFWGKDQVRAWVNRTHHGVPDGNGKWINEPRSPKTVRNLHALLSSYGAWLVEKGLRPTNPCDGTRLPESDEGDADIEMVFLEQPEYMLLRDSFPEREARDLIDFLAGTGCRYGEATALKIKDLVLDPPGGDPHLLIRRAWKRQPNGSHLLGRPKSRASRRRVELIDNDFVIALLRRVTKGRTGEEFVFLTPTGVHWQHANFYNRPWLQGVWKAVRCDRHRADQHIDNMHDLKRRHAIPCGCPGTLANAPRIHDLRHTNAAWLIAAGVPLMGVQRQLGHESYRTTEKRYGHLTAAVKAGMGAASNAALSFAAGPFVPAEGAAVAALIEQQRGPDRRRRQRMLGLRRAAFSSRGAASASATSPPR